MNKHRPHVYVLPEDDANRSLANGFLLHPQLDLRSIQVLPNVGGSFKVRDQFESEHVVPMERYKDRNMILLLDFDETSNRHEIIAKVIPSHLRERVFILSIWSEPEDLTRAGLGSLEHVGSKLAEECKNETRETWDHALLRHNRGELDRMIPRIKKILFPN